MTRYEKKSLTLADFCYIFKKRMRKSDEIRHSFFMLSGSAKGEIREGRS